MGMAGGASHQRRPFLWPQITALEFPRDRTDDMRTANASPTGCDCGSSVMRLTRSVSSHLELISTKGGSIHSGFQGGYRHGACE